MKSFKLICLFVGIIYAVMLAIILGKLNAQVNELNSLVISMCSTQQENPTRHYDEKTEADKIAEEKARQDSINKARLAEERKAKEEARQDSINKALEEALLAEKKKAKEDSINQAKEEAIRKANEELANARAEIIQLINRGGPNAYSDYKNTQVYTKLSKKDRIAVETILNPGQFPPAKRAAIKALLGSKKGSYKSWKDITDTQAEIIKIINEQ